MMIGRTLPPATAPIVPFDLIGGFVGMLSASRSIERFHKSLRAQFGMKHCFTFSSGKTGITITLRALHQRHPKRDLVVIPAFNCYSVPSAIVRAGCTVYPCDIDPENLNFNETALTKVLANHERILAVCPAHLFGLPANIKRIRELIHDPEITIIEDAAQAMGTALNNPSALIGDVVIFSLGRGKAFSTGEGGVVVTNNDHIANMIHQTASSLPEYSHTQVAVLITQCIILLILIHPRLFWIPKAIPFLKLGDTIFDAKFPMRVLSGFQAGCAVRWQKRLMVFNKERDCHSNYYSASLSSLKRVQLFVRKNDSVPCIRFPVLFESPAIAQKVLMEGDRNGLGIACTFPDAIDMIPGISIFTTTPCLQARSVARRILTLPCHPLVRKADMDKIIEIIRSCTGEP